MMHNICIILILLFLPISSLGQKSKIFCTLTSEKTVYCLGELPKISVNIKNATDSVIELVKSLDGSTFNLRYPYAYFKIENMTDSLQEHKSLELCGNTNPIRLTDFVKVMQGDSFDPLKDSFDKLYPGNFPKRGKYKVTFYYSTNECDLLKWMGDEGYDYSKNEIAAPKKAAYEQLLRLFAKVPRVELISNTLIITIK